MIRKKIKNKKWNYTSKIMVSILLASMMLMGTVGCSSTATISEETANTVSETTDEAQQSSAETVNEVVYLTKDDIEIKETYEASQSDEHAINADGDDATYSNIAVSKTGDSDGDESDFYGTNAAVYASDGATLTISDSLIETSGKHANAVFAYGEGTTINISDSLIETSDNTSGGIMVTGGGTLNATNLTINTSGNSSAAIRSDRGGGTMNVSGGYYKTSGTGSPVVYSTAEVTLSDAYMESTASQGIVVEGKNSVTLNNVTLVADNNTKNSKNSDYYQAVMIYQSMSGDADEGTSSFAMNGGSLTNKNGDIFFITNTSCEITLNNVSITNEDGEGIFLRASSAGWGKDGSNGGKVNLYATSQIIEGDIIVDEVSELNLYLKSASSFTGAINNSGEAGEVNVELSEGSTWTLTADSYITSLSCDGEAINLNGYTLYVNGEIYQ